MNPKIETYELTNLHGKLTALAKRDLTASGIHISMHQLDHSPIGDMVFEGELLPQLIPVLLASIESTLKLRLAVAAGDMSRIKAILVKE